MVKLDYMKTFLGKSKKRIIIYPLAVIQISLTVTTFVFTHVSLGGLTVKITKCVEFDPVRIPPS